MEPVRVVSGRVQVLDRADVDTDQIVSKQFLKRIERTGFGEFLFRDWRREGLELDPGCPILATGRNFGCGSSREHAVWALQDFGFRALVAPSFADIFYANCAKTGLLAVTLSEPDVRSLMEFGRSGARAGEATVNLERQMVCFAEREVAFEVSPELREHLLEGLDEISLTLSQADEIGRFEREHQELGSLTSRLTH